MTLHRKTSMTTYLSEFKRFGFRRSEIVPFLKEAGVDIAQALDAIRTSTPRAPQTAVDASPRAPSPPDWHVLIATWDWLNIDQCAHVMLDQNPLADYGLNYYDNADDWRLWRQTLEQACNSIDSRRELRNMEIKGVFQIAPRDLIDWCQRCGYRCPLIPPGDPLPTDHAALAVRCTDAERQRDAQRARAEKAEKERDALLSHGNAPTVAMPVDMPRAEPLSHVLDETIRSTLRAEAARQDAVRSGFDTLRVQLETTKSPTPAGTSWPWGNYTTPALELLAQMAKRYVSDGACNAKAEAIKADVVNAGLSDRVAEGISQMLRTDSEGNRKLNQKRTGNLSR